jgi:hypothetical protein
MIVQCIYRVKSFLSGCAALFLLAKCDQSTYNKTSQNIEKEEKKTFVKPPSIFSDTITITSKAAIFYYPDSIQLERMRADSDTVKFDAMMHEYDYQFRYAHTVLSKNWPGINIFEIKNARYLQFRKTNNSSKIIDLNTKNDPYGLFVFNTSKDPIQIDMTNADSEMSFYFSNTNQK